MGKWVGGAVFFAILFGILGVLIANKIQNVSKAPPVSPLQEYANKASERQEKRWAEEAKAKEQADARFQQLKAEERADIKEKDKLLAEMKYVSNRLDLGEISEAEATTQASAIKSRLESLVKKMKKRQNEAHEINTGKWQPK